MLNTHTRLDPVPTCKQSAQLFPFSENEVREHLRVTSLPLSQSFLVSVIAFLNKIFKFKESLKKPEQVKFSLPKLSEPCNYI